jgi:hypothetical protein
MLIYDDTVADDVVGVGEEVDEVEDEDEEGIDKN